MKLFRTMRDSRDELGATAILVALFFSFIAIIAVSISARLRVNGVWQ